MTYVVYKKSDNQWRENDGPIAVFRVRDAAMIRARRFIEQMADEGNADAIVWATRSGQEALAKDPDQKGMHYKWVSVHGLRPIMMTEREWAEIEQTRLDGLTKRAEENPYFNVRAATYGDPGYTLIDEGIYVRGLS